MLTEDEARAAARVRDQDVKVGAAGVAIDSLPIRQAASRRSTM